MEPKKELDEKTYQANKKKLNMIALGVLITAVVIGLGLIIVPRIVMTTPAPVANTDTTATETATTTIPAVEIKRTALSEVELNAQIAAIEAEYTKKFGDDGWFEEQVTISDRVSAARAANRAAEAVDSAAESAQSSAEWDAARAQTEAEFDAEVAKSNATFEAAKAKSANDSTIFSMTAAGMMVIFVGVGIAGGLFYFANFRKVAGYAAQGVMPVAKEVITEIAPVMGAASGTAMKAAAPGIGDVAREIKEGINEADAASKK